MRSWLPATARQGEARRGHPRRSSSWWRSSARRSPRTTRRRRAPRRRRAGPSAAHLLGTTSSGQDILSQLLVGMRSTVVLGLLTGVIATFIAVVVGVSAGFLGGAGDEALSLFANVFLVLPALPLLIVLLGYLPPSSGELPTAIVLSALGWPWGARVIRAQTLTLRNRDYVAGGPRAAASAAGGSSCSRSCPNEVSLIAASFVGTVLYAILTSVALAFIGVASLSGWNLGTMLYWAQSQEAIQTGAWWWYVPPGVSVALLGMSLVLLNFGLDELGNPRLRDSGRSRVGGRIVRASDPTPVVRETGMTTPQPIAAGAPAAAAGAPAAAAGAGDPRTLSIAYRAASRATSASCATSTSALAPRRDRRPRRGERVREVDARARRVPAAAPAGGDHRRQRHLPRPAACRPGVSTMLDMTARRAARAAVARDRDRLPERDERAQPGAAGRRSARRRDRRPPRRSPRGEARAAPDAARPRRDPARAAAQLSARALRRHAPARDDRDGARRRARGRDHGRADDRARCRRPARDPGARSSSCRSS